MEIVRVTRFDETYDRIVCDPGISQELNQYFSFDVPGAKFMPAYKNKVWNGKIYIYKMVHGLLYCGLRTRLEIFCRERNYLIEYDFDTSHTEFSLVEGEEFVKTLGLTLQPRDYQMKAFVAGVREGRALFLSPTASGKSLIIYLMQRYYNARTLVVVPTISLVHQMTSDFESYSGVKEDVHKIISGEEKTPMYYTFTLENGNKYIFEGNEYIKLINSNHKRKLAKEITIDDDIDNRWLQQQTSKQIL